MDLIGQSFGRLRVIGIGERKASGRITWRCQCDCGNVKDITPADLRHGGTKSCGCARKESAIKIGLAKIKPDADKRHPLHARWSSMLQRCGNPKSPYFKNYGARGIEVCDRWKNSFRDFVEDIGIPPTPKHTIDRIDNNGPYSPENCRWATQDVQHRNTRRSILITAFGETLSPKAWAARLGINFQRITYAYRKGGIDAATQVVISAK